MSPTGRSWRWSEERDCESERAPRPVSKLSQKMFRYLLYTGRAGFSFCRRPSPFFANISRGCTDAAIELACSHRLTKALAAKSGGRWRQLFAS